MYTAALQNPSKIRTNTRLKYVSNSYNEKKLFYEYTNIPVADNFVANIIGEKKIHSLKNYDPSDCT